MYFIAGINVIRCYLESTYCDNIKKIYLSQDKRHNRKLIELVRNIKLVEYVSVDVLNKIFADKHQGIIAELYKPMITMYDMKYLKNVINSTDNDVVLLLDGVTDPHNMGAIIRSAVYFGVTHIIIANNNSVKNMDMVVARASSGAVFMTKIVVVANLARTLRLMQNYGYWLFGGSVDESAVDIKNIKAQNKMVLILGSESVGMRRVVREMCDFLVKIPTKVCKVQSLNVSVACGVLLFGLLCG